MQNHEFNWVYLYCTNQIWFYLDFNFLILIYILNICQLVKLYESTHNSNDNDLYHQTKGTFRIDIFILFYFCFQSNRWIIFSFNSIQRLI
jgi:hypothetical protein